MPTVARGVTADWRGGGRAAGAGAFADSLQALQSDMDANEEGAFLPWHQQPFVKAILLPFGGSGVLQAVEFMMSKQ